VSDLGYVLCAVALLVVCRFAFKDATKADEEESKLDQK